MGPPKQRRHWRWKSRRQRGMEYRSQQQLPPSKVKPENERRDVREAPEPVDRKSSKVEAGIDRDTKSEARLRAENKNLKQYRATSNGPGTTDFDLADWYHSQKLESLDSVSAIKAIVGQLDLLRQEAGWPFLYVAYEAPPVSYVRKKKWSSAPVYDFETISSCAMERKEYFSTEAFLADATHAVVSISEEKGELGKRFRIAGLLDGISRQPLPDTAELEGIWDEMTEWALTLAEMKPLNFDDADDFDAHLKRCDKCLDEFRERFVVRLTASEPIGIICRSYFPPGTKWRGTMARCTKRRNKNPQRMQEELCSTWTHFVTANPFLWPGTISGPKLNILTAEYEQGKWKPEAGGVKKECRSETSGMISHDDLAVEFALRQGQNFRFAPWFNRVAQLKERPVKDAIGVIARVFRGQGANKGSLISERRRCLVDAKLVDGGCVHTPSPSASKGKKRRAIDSEGPMNSRPLSNPERDSLPVSSELGVAGGAKRARLPAVLDECYSLRLKTALDMVTEERGRFGQHAARFDRFEYHVKGLLDGCVTKEQVQEASRKMFEERCIDSLISLFDSYLNVFLYKLTPDDQEKLETVLSSLKQLLEDMDVVNNLEVVPPLEDNAVVAVSTPLP